MKSEELKKEIEYCFKNLEFDIDYVDFNLYKITIYIVGKPKEFEYKYDNHLTVIGNGFKLNEIIKDKIISFYQEKN